MALKLGKTPARPGAASFAMARYLTPDLPAPPTAFGHQSLVGEWGMLGNDRARDCVWAGAAHETETWTAEGQRPATFTTLGVLSDYSAVTGFDPSRPETDCGTDMEVAAKYRRQTGVVDAGGRRHRVGAYLAIAAGDLGAHLTAAWLFGAVGIGIEFPASAMDQFNAGEPWDVASGSRIEGGHYVPLVGADEEYLYVVTWGRTQAMTRAFFETYNDESIAYLSEEALRGGVSVEGFSLAQLQADLEALGSPPRPEPVTAAARALAASPETDRFIRSHHFGYLAHVAALVRDVTTAVTGLPS